MFLQFLADHSGFQQARTHLRNPSARQCDSTPPSAGLGHENQKPKLSAQELAPSRLFCQMGRQGECVAVVPREPQLHIHARLKSLLTWQKSWGSHPVALWRPQAADTSFCPLLYSFIVQNDPGSAVALVDFPIGTHMQTQTIRHSTFEAHGRQPASFSFPTSSSTDPSVLTQADLPLTTRCMYYLYFGMDII